MSPHAAARLASRTGLKVPAFMRAAVPATSLIEFIVVVVVVAIVVFDVSEPGSGGAGDVFDGPINVAICEYWVGARFCQGIGQQARQIGQQNWHMKTKI